MAKIVVGLFDMLEDAQATVRDLVDQGFHRDSISMVANDASGEYGRHFHEGEKTDDIAGSAASGAGIGAVIGGLGGLLVGLGALAIPGIGPVLAAGPIVSALAGAGIGAAAGGLLGALVEAGIPEEQANWYAEGVRRGGTLVTVSTSDDMANHAVDIMNRHNPVDIEKRASEWQSQNWKGFGSESQPLTHEDIDRDRASYMANRTREGETSLPVAEEELQVGKRDVYHGGVRVHTRVTETPVEEQVNLRKEQVDVERRPVDRNVSPNDPDIFKEGTIEMTETSEEPIVRKDAHIVEEVVVRKDVTEETETIHDTVRRTDVDVERFGGRDQTTSFTNDAEYDRYFQNHYNTTFGNTSYTYDQYRPYYMYGSQLASDERYRNRNWNDIEMEARRDWERSHPDSAWEDFKDAVRHGWDTIRGRR